MKTMSNINHLVLAAVGRNMPGLVNALTNLTSNSGCNIEDSRMTKMGSEFAVIMLLTGHWNALAKLESTLPGFEQQHDIKTVVRRTEPVGVSTDLMPYLVQVVALDHPGIVYQVTDFFAKRDIDIVDLFTTTYPASHTGATMFSLNMKVHVPGDMQLSSLREEFIIFCDELNLDAIIEPDKQQ